MSSRRRTREAARLSSPKSSRTVFEMLEQRTLLTGELLITEFLAVNDSGLADEDGARSDWIEIHNTTGAPVNLAGWALTDDDGELSKWVFPAVSISANGYQIVFASEKNRAVPGQPLHTNFKLSSGGEYLALVRPGGVVEQEYAPEFPPQVANVSYGLATGRNSWTLFTAGASARVMVPSDESLEQTWTGLEFDDSAWTAGPTGVGYERQSGYQALIGTDVGSAMYGINSSAYIRIAFNVDDPTALDSLNLRMKYDDGFVAYLNGEEAAAANAPADPVYNSSATAAREAGTNYDEFDISSYRGSLLRGENVLAIHAMNVSPSDPDFLVLPELVAAGPADQNDLGLARYFLTPTPGARNGAGTTDLGPIFADVAYTPANPGDSSTIVVTATMRQALNPVASVSLKYRVAYGSETSLTMYDDGAHGDGTAHDGVYGASIPASASSPGQMVRWYLSANDTASKTSRWPLYAVTSGVNQSEQYLGTVIVNPAVSSQLPILQWFVQTPSAADADPGTRCSLYYNGEFYDNVYVRIRGGSVRSYPKKSYKFEFGKDHLFSFSPDESRVEEININTTYTDKSYIRTALSHETFDNIGAAGPISFMMRLQQNNAFFSVATFVEQPDEDFLAREGFDPAGAFYKICQDNALTSSTNRVEKKSRKTEDNSDLQALVDGVHLTGTASTIYVYDNINIPACIDYLVAIALTNDADCGFKNYYVCRDTEGTGEWTMLPWDKDLTFGRNWSSTQGVLNDVIGLNGIPPITWNYLTKALTQYNTTTMEMFYRRLRTAMDSVLQAPGTPSGQLDFEQRITALVAQMTADVSLDRAKWGNPYGANQDFATAINILKTQYLAPLRTSLYVTKNIHNGGLIPDAQPADVSLSFGAVEYAPVSLDEDQEYAQIVNGNSYAVDISGWKLSGGVDFTFKPGTVIPSNSSLYVSPNVVAFRARTSGPQGGAGLFVLSPYQGHLANDGETVWLLDAGNRQVASVFAGPSNVVINEIDPHSNEAMGDWIELYNPTASAVAISGWYISDDPLTPMKYQIPAGTTLLPGQYASFNQRDHFGGLFAFSKDGDEAVLTTAAGQTVDRRDFGASDPDVPFGRYVTGDGAVHFVSLSAATRGSANAYPLVGPVVINEIMYHPLDGNDEFIELHNTTDQPVLLYDSLNPANAWKLSSGVGYTFPPGQTLPAHGYMVVTAADLSDPADLAAFRTKYGIPGNVQVFGPYTGKLDNAGETVQLSKPADPELDGTVPHIRIDHVEYKDALPWPVKADGEGMSLERVSPAAYGNESGNWQGIRPGGTAGRANTLMGDANDDLSVDGGDYCIWADHFGQNGTGWVGGDFNSDGTVNNLDRDLWSGRYGTVIPPDPPPGGQSPAEQPAPLPLSAELQPPQAQPALAELPSPTPQPEAPQGWPMLVPPAPALIPLPPAQSQPAPSIPQVQNQPVQPEPIPAKPALEIQLPPPTPAEQAAEEGLGQADILQDAIAPGLAAQPAAGPASSDSDDILAICGWYRHTQPLWVPKPWRMGTLRRRWLKLEVLRPLPGVPLDLLQGPRL